MEGIGFLQLDGLRRNGAERIGVSINPESAIFDPLIFNADNSSAYPSGKDCHRDDLYHGAGNFQFDLRYLEPTCLQTRR